MMNPDGTFQEDIQCIVPEQNGRGAIFISNLQAACNPNTLKKHKIQAVITAIKGKNLAQKIPRHIEYFYIPVVDHEQCDISMFFKDSYQFIEQQRKRTNVLVHCMAGVSRSVTLVIAYIMQKSRTPFDTAFQYVKSKRKIIHPNQSFIKQLKQLEKRLQIHKNQPQNTQNKQNKRTQNYNIQKSRVSEFNEQSFSKKAKYGSIRGYCQNKIQNLESTKCSEWNGNQGTSKLNKFTLRKSQQNIRTNQQNSRKKEQNIKKDIYKNYDESLRQNIKKLFSLNNSKTNFYDKSQLIK